jgi:hypothetical protein
LEEGSETKDDSWNVPQKNKRMFADYILIIYIDSGAAKVNSVYSKTRVKSELTRSRDATICESLGRRFGNKR